MCGVTQKFPAHGPIALVNEPNIRKDDQSCVAPRIADSHIPWFGADAILMKKREFKGNHLYDWNWKSGIGLVSGRGISEE